MFSEQPASAESIPITYTDEHGKQYGAIVATGGGLLRAPLLSDELIAFKLDDGAGGGPNVVKASPNPTASQPSVAPRGLPGPAPGPGPEEESDPCREAALLPPGPGRNLTVRACSTSCHALDIVN